MPLKDERLMIGIVAQRAGVGIDTVRFYERCGLLPRARRTDGGYRVFPESSIRSLRFIKNAQALGFTLREVKQLLKLQVVSGGRCGDVRRRAKVKLDDIERRIDSLRVMKRALLRLVSACTSTGPAKRCSFLENLKCTET